MLISLLCHEVTTDSSSEMDCGVAEPFARTRSVVGTQSGEGQNQHTFLVKLSGQRPETQPKKQTLAFGSD